LCDQAPAGAAIAVTTTATIAQLGFDHEDSGQSFVLDFADLHRDKLTIPAAFRAIKSARADPSLGIERVARRTVGAAMRREA
jgi:CRISPR-associated protein Cas1